MHWDAIKERNNNVDQLEVIYREVVEVEEDEEFYRKIDNKIRQHREKEIKKYIDEGLLE